MPLVDLSIPNVEDAAVRVDARADEPAWAGALVIDDFVAFQPVFDQVPRQPTTVRVLTDAQGIWFHFTATDDEPDKVRAGQGRRDTRWSDDWCALYLDPSGDAQRSYLFVVNPLGVQSDGTNVSGAPEDPAWDGRWLSAGRRTDQGYEVELGIPWDAIRHPADASRMGLFVFRHVARTGEKSSWPRLDPNVSGLLAQEAVLGGPGALDPAFGLSLTPELTFGWTQDGPSEDRLGVGGVAPGLTVNFAPSPALQVLGTFNPDFSQVESDTSQIDTNRRFALSYPEKRSFFLQGQEWFNHPFPNLLYTRSMVAPYYGVRATAEVGGWTTAALHVLDAHPAPSVNELGGWSPEDLGENPAFETIARLRRSVGPDAFVGAVFSDRSVLGTGLWNRVGGLDTHVRLSDEVVADGALLASSTSFGPGSPLEDGRVAPAGLWSMSYASRVVGIGATADAVAPDFRAENGFVTWSDRLGGSFYSGVELYPKSSVLPRASFYPLQVQGALTTDLAPRAASIDPVAVAVFGNGGNASVTYSHAGEAFADVWLAYDSATLDASVPWSRFLTTGGGARTGTAPLYDPALPTVGWQDDLWCSVVLQPVPALATEFTSTWERFLLDGDELYEGWVAHWKVEVFANRRLWARLVADRSTFRGQVRGDALLAWEHSPGSAFYVGGSRTVADPTAVVPAEGLDAWQVFAKGSWVFTL